MSADTYIPPCSLKWRLVRERSETCIVSHIGSCIAMVTWGFQIPNTSCLLTQIGCYCWKQGYKDIACFPATLVLLHTVKGNISSYAESLLNPLYLCSCSYGHFFPQENTTKNEILYENPTQQHLEKLCLCQTA